MSGAIILDAVVLLIAGFFVFTTDALSQRWNIIRVGQTRRFWIFACGFVVVSALGVNRTTSWGMVQMGLVVAALIASTITDLESGFVFDVVTLPTLGVLYVLAGGIGLANAIYASGACAGVIFTIFAITGGRGIGLGDLKLAACIGAALGMSAGLMAIGAAFIIGAAHGMLLLAKSKIKRGEPLRFAPYLAAGAVISVFWAGASWP